MPQIVDALLHTLEKDIPRLRQDANMFPVVFEERACKIFEIEDTDRVNERLVKMLVRAGVAPHAEPANFHCVLAGAPFNSMSGPRE